MRNRFFVVLAIVAAGCGASGSSGEPRVVREDQEWLDVWVPEANARGLPRVLLIGDSIVRWYGPQVEQKLQGTAYVARLATSKSIGDPALLLEVSLILSQSRFDVIHFNNGLHGFGYTEAEYRAGFPELVATLRRLAPSAKLIWATSTPILNEGNRRVEARNAIAAPVIDAAKISTNDLYALMANHPEYQMPDGVHFNDQGIAAQAGQVVERIKAVLTPEK